MTVATYGESSADSWASMVVPVAELAAQIKETDMVPKWLRGNAPAITAVVLYGRELGLPPMTALRSLHIIDGKPSMSAEAMRALALAAGHVIEYPELTNASCTARGRRKDSGTWVTVTWTREDARRAGLNNPSWTKYPRAMLAARATAELCRLAFPDVVSGVAAVEESDDIEPTTTRVRRGTSKRELVEIEPPDLPADDGPPRTSAVAEAPAELPTKGPSSAGVTDDLERGAEHPSGPKLTTADVDRALATARANLEAGLGPVEDVPRPPGLVPHAEAVEGPDGSWTEAQRRHVMALFGELGITDRTQRLELASACLGRDLKSANDMSQAEATKVIDALIMAKHAPDPGAFVADLRRQHGLVVDEPMFTEHGAPIPELPEPELPEL